MRFDAQVLGLPWGLCLDARQVGSSLRDLAGSL